jgi:hypothetical protein
MDSRLILKKEKKLGILIDSTSFENLLSNEDEDTKNLLGYAEASTSSKFFQFVRSPLETNYEALKRVSEFIKTYNDRGELFAIKVIESETSWTETVFYYRIQDIEKIGKVIFKKEVLDDKEMEAIFLVFVQATLNSSRDSRIFITENKKILENRLWLESHYPGHLLNIVTLEEAKEIMDLFTKYNGKYFIRGNFTCNKGYWYWLSFRSEIPNFHVGDSFLDAFSTRFIYLLMAIDEIGFQYYLGVNNDTLDNMRYHLNYFITLTASIFDSLALSTKNGFDLYFEGDTIPSRTSLDPSAGKGFLKALREKNSNLRNHINKYVDFIKLIYELREAVVHREIPQGIRFAYDDHDEKWQSNFIRINEEIKKQIHRCGDSNQKYDPISMWGVYNISTEYLLEPFSFAKSAARVLIELSNEYLKMLGYGDFLEELRSKRDESSRDPFLRDIEEFKNNRLGF